MIKKRFLSMLVLLAAVVTGAVAQTTYKVSVKEGTDDAANWQGKAGEGEYQALPLEGVAAGTAVSVKYNGTKKVKSVKAVKKAAAKPALSLTSPSVGQVIGSDGKNYAAASVPSGVTKVAMIAYVSGSNGLAIALADEGSLNWATAKSTCEAKTPAFTNGTWHLPSQAEWNNMFSANGGNAESYNGLNAAINTAGGTTLQSGFYWSSSEYSPGVGAHLVHLDDGDADWSKANETLGRNVRACLAFTVEPAAPASTPLDNTTTAWTAGTFAVPAGGLTYSAAITVSGDVTLVLTDGTTLTLNKGISIASGATLTIQGNGTMAVNGTNNSTASTVAGSTGTLILTSGTLTATGGNGGSVGEWRENSHGGAGGAAINGTVIVDGGTLTAKGGNGGSVGEWSEDSHGGAGGAAISGSLTINAGTVTTTNGAAGSVGDFCEGCSGGAAGKAVAGTVTDKR